MKLYHHPASPNARACRVAARLLQLPVEEVLVDAMRGEQSTPAYLAINPNGLFPALVDEGFRLWETAAILHYLAEARPEVGLLPATRQARADVIRWQAWALAHWQPSLRVYLFENVFRAIKGGGPPDQAALAAAEPGHHRLAALLEAHLSRQRWLAGEGLTIADLMTGSFLMYRDAAKIPLERYPHVGRWFECIASLPAWQETEPSW